ncbi:MAG: adenylate kinase [Candidatus Aminicenantes bacterium]|nr:adenylate kinase [Candidatus Aminicenantes bacterium]
MRIILLGPPGSGKGTQGEMIERKFNLPRIATGDILREAVKLKTPLGLAAEAQIKAGHLVSDEIVASLVAERIKQSDCLQGYILDGFPRNLNQIKLLEKMDNCQEEIAIEIYVPEETVIKRLVNRRICSSCGTVYNIITSPPQRFEFCDFCGGQLIQREDDNAEVIRERLRIYETEIKDIREHYCRKGVFYKINGEGSVDEVFKRIEIILESKIKKKV